MSMEPMKMSESKKPSPTKVLTGVVRLSYAHIWKARPSLTAGGPDKFSTAILIPKTDKETIAKIKAAVAAASELGKANYWGGKLPPNLKTPLRDGDAERPDDPVYKGHMFLNAASSDQPGIVDRQKNEIMDQSEVYSGCYARVVLNMFPFSMGGNKGIGAGLQHIMKWVDGPRLSGRSTAEEDFAEISGDEEDEFMK